MLKENGTLIALFVLVFVILALFWWFDQQGQTLAPQPLASPSPSPVAIDKEALKNDLLKRYNQPADSINLAVTEVREGFARGIARFVSDSRVWLWLAYQEKNSGNWRLVHDGQGLPVCQSLVEVDFPVDLADQCWDSQAEAISDR